MRKIRAFVFAAVLSAALVVPALPAHAFMCEPDIQTVCQVVFGPFCGGLPKTHNCY